MTTWIFIGPITHDQLGITEKDWLSAGPIFNEKRRKNQPREIKMDERPSLFRRIPSEKKDKIVKGLKDQLIKHYEKIGTSPQIEEGEEMYYYTELGDVLVLLRVNFSNPGLLVVSYRLNGDEYSYNKSILSHKVEEEWKDKDIKSMFNLPESFQRCVKVLARLTPIPLRNQT